jgi:predicted RNase H-like HicB family nuclease
MARSKNLCYPTGMKTIVQFNISQEDGTYTADGVNVPIVTEGATFEELQENIRDAVALYFEGSDPSSLGFAATPSILTNFEVSPPLYAGRA